ncbi:phosphotransferase [Mycobacteroides abscessus subsp. abscessus]|nr:phosphotransferase [Mycobacteroides abscessus subsp. abscessus]
MPTDACPWTWSPAERISDARSRGIDVQLEATDAPTIDRAVVCHGDACCPNFLLSDPGQVTAYVDLGSLGVADRWADIAVAAMSTEWDYGPGWERPLVEAYGVDFDEERMSFYQRLWDST